MGKGRTIQKKNVKPHHRDKSYYVILDGSPVEKVELKNSREVAQEPLSRRNKRPSVDYVGGDGFSTRHRTVSARILDDRVLDKGIQIYRHWFQFLKLALELESLGKDVELVTRHGMYLPTEEPFIRVEGNLQPNPDYTGDSFFRQRDTVLIRVDEKSYEGWDLDQVLSDTFNTWWSTHAHLFEGHYPKRITSKDEWDDDPNFVYVRIDKTSRRPDLDTFIQTIKDEMSQEGSPRFPIDGYPRPDVLQNRYNALVMVLKGFGPKEICTHKKIYLRATDSKTDGERLMVPMNSKGKSLYPIVVKQQRDGGIHHLLDVMKGCFGSVLSQERGFRAR